MTLLSYILHRRTDDGFLDSLAPASAADQVLLANRMAGARRRPGGSGDAAQDAMSSFLGGD